MESRGPTDGSEAHLQLVVEQLNQEIVGDGSNTVGPHGKSIEIHHTGEVAINEAELVEEDEGNKGVYVLSCVCSNLGVLSSQQIDLVDKG